MPRTIRGWFAIIACAALLLFVLMRCQFSMSFGTTPVGPNGEPSEPYFSIDFSVWDTPRYTVIGREPC